MLTIGDDLASRHYAEHIDKPFYGELAAFITSGPVVAMQWSGESAVGVARTLMGTTNPAEAAPGTIRGDFGAIITENIVHGSDSPASAERELGLFFQDR
jgi:nucleoside-diphosphate kinase